MADDCICCEKLFASEEYCKNGKLKSVEIGLVLLVCRACPEGLLVVVVKQGDVPSIVFHPHEHVGELSVEFNLFARTFDTVCVCSSIVVAAVSCVVQVRHLVQHVAGLELEHLIGDEPLRRTRTCHAFPGKNAHDEHAQETGLPDMHHVVDLEIEAIESRVENQRLAVVGNADVVCGGEFCRGVCEAGPQLCETLRRGVVHPVIVSDGGKVVAVEQPRVRGL